MGASCSAGAGADGAESNAILRRAMRLLMCRAIGVEFYRVM